MGYPNARRSETSDVIPMFSALVWKIQLVAQLRASIDAQVLAALARMGREFYDSSGSATIATKSPPAG